MGRSTTIRSRATGTPCRNEYRYSPPPAKYGVFSVIVSCSSTIEPTATPGSGARRTCSEE